MVLDGSKEQCHGNFMRKLREADCHLRQTEPYPPWQQAAEGCIRELKQGVSRKMIAALNDLDVKVGNALNAYITAPVKEKVWTVLGPEFGPDAGRSAIIVRVLYGLNQMTMFGITPTFSATLTTYCAYIMTRC